MPSPTNPLPITPAKHSTPTPSNPPSNAKLHDSPFSDYFTDDGQRSPSSISSPEKRQVLLRLGRLQALLMRGEAEGGNEGEAEEDGEREVLSIVERKVNEIEIQLSALHSQTRVPPEMEDSGLFMSEDDDDEVEVDEGETGLQLGSEAAASPISTYRTHDPDLLHSSTEILHLITRANTSLRARHSELRALHTAHSRALDALRAENTYLRSDLATSEAQLLLLRCQFQVLEMEVRALEDGAERLEGYAPELRGEIQRVRRERVGMEMQRWGRRWEGVEGDVRRRRSTRGKNGYEGEEKEDVAGREMERLRVGVGELHLETYDGDIEEEEEGRESSILPAQQEPREIDVEIDITTTPSPGVSEAPPRDIEIDIITTEDAQPPVLLFEDDDNDNDPEETDLDLDDFHIDCAITTSSEDNIAAPVPLAVEVTMGEGNAEKAVEVSDGFAYAASPPKTAWQELMEGLASFAGMRED